MILEHDSPDVIPNSTEAGSSNDKHFIPKYDHSQTCDFHENVIQNLKATKV